MAPGPRPNVRKSGPRVKDIPEAIVAGRGLVAEIKRSVAYAAIAYCDSAARNQDNRNSRMVSRYARFEAAVDDAHSDTHAVIYTDTLEREVVVAFRGSDSGLKFFEAFLYFPVDYPGVPGAWVSQKPYEFAARVADEIATHVARLLGENPFYRVKLVGHSLGGAIATLAAPMLTQRLDLDPRRIHIITFGQPRVGNRAFVRHYNRIGFDFSRVVNKNDPSPSHPPFRKGWAHVQREIFINDRDIFILCDTTDLEDPACSHEKGTPLAISRHHEYVAQVKLSPRGCGFWDFL